MAQIASVQPTLQAQGGTALTDVRLGGIKSELPGCVRTVARVVTYGVIGISTALVANCVANVLMMPHTPYFNYRPDYNPYANFTEFKIDLIMNLVCGSPIAYGVGAGLGIAGGLVGQVVSGKSAVSPLAGMVGAIPGGVIAGGLMWIAEWAMWFILVPF